MLPETPPWQWTAVFGATGGVLNALLTSDSRLLWSWVQGTAPPARQLARIGLLANLAIGALAAVAAFLAFAYSLDEAARSTWMTESLPLIAASSFFGFAVARLATNELDKRLLRAAACKACAAPGAHPDTVDRLATAPPGVAFAIADELMPRSSQR